MKIRLIKLVTLFMLFCVTVAFSQDSYVSTNIVLNDEITVPVKKVPSWNREAYYASLIKETSSDTIPEKVEKPYVQPDMNNLRLYNLSLRNPDTNPHYTSNIYVSASGGALYDWAKPVNNEWVFHSRGQAGIMIEIDEVNHSYLDFFVRTGGSSSTGVLNEIGGKLMWSWTNIGFKNPYIWGRFGPYGTFTFGNKGDSGFGTPRMALGGEMSFHISELLEVGLAAEKDLGLTNLENIQNGDYLFEATVRVILSSIWKKDIEE